MFDGKAFGEEIVGIVRSYVDEAVAPLKAESESLKARIAELEARPAPEKGEKGDPGEKGADGKDGRDGADGKDGLSAVEFFVDREGHLIASMSDGTTRDLGEIVGKDGAPGKDGRDGFGFDDMDACVLDDDRTIELSFRRGDEEKAFTFKWPTIIDRGVFKAGETYQAGDGVTWGGSFWIAQRETDAKPDTAESGWRLAVKRGRDGKNG